MQDNKKDWHSKLIFYLWDERVSTKMSIDASCFQLVYGDDLVFHPCFRLHVMKILQDHEEETNDVHRRMN